MVGEIKERKKNNYWNIKQKLSVKVSRDIFQQNEMISIFKKYNSISHSYIWEFTIFGARPT